MIKLITNTNNSLRHIEKEISNAKTFDQCKLIYQELIQKYKLLDKDFKFTEAIDEDYIFFQLRDQFDNRQNSPLFGIPFGIKDIFNTKVLPTSMGSEIWRGFRAGNNARIVDEIYDRGGVIFSKTTTAEFAVHFITPKKTLNPYNNEHITGTSSSGSAVAVSCGALPVALGTQTAGSILRPASFCGVYGYKPSFGAIDRTGVLKTNDTLDTIGILGSDIYGLRKVLVNVLQQGKDYPYSKNYFESHIKYRSKEAKKLRIGVLAGAFNYFHNYKEYVKVDFEAVVKQLEKTFNTIVIDKADDLNNIHILHERIYSKSLSYYFKNEIRNYNSVSEVMRDMIGRGENIRTEDYIEAIKLQPLLRMKFNKIFEEFDFIVTPSTASAAPLLGQVELPDTCLIWTFLGYPTISIPLFINPELNLPYGLQIVAKKFDDFSLLEFSEQLETMFN